MKVDQNGLSNVQSDYRDRMPSDQAIKNQGCLGENESDNRKHFNEALK